MIFPPCIPEPPSAPVITGLNQTQTLREGQLVRLTCSSNDGSPAPDLAWYRGDTNASLLPEVRVVLHPTAGGLNPALTIEFVATREDNHRTYR